MSQWLTDQFHVVSFGEMVVRLLSAVVLSILIGLEREARNKPAGLRTNALVALGSAGHVLAVVQAHRVLKLPEQAVEFDPTGLIAAVAGGIGFLGAGAIFRSQADVKGLTTGASIWISGAIGTSCGVGQIILAATLGATALIVLVGLKPLEHLYVDSSTEDDETPRHGHRNSSPYPPTEAPDGQAAGTQTVK